MVFFLALAILGAICSVIAIFMSSYAIKKSIDNSSKILGVDFYKEMIERYLENHIWTKHNPIN